MSSIATWPFETATELSSLQRGMGNFFTVPLSPDTIPDQQGME